MTILFARVLKMSLTAGRGSTDFVWSSGQAERIRELQEIYRSQQ